jgi:hypothetical protein
VNLKFVSRCASPLESLWLVGKSSIIRFGGERRQLCDGFVRRMKRPLICGKLRSEGGIKVTERLGVRLNGQALGSQTFVASQEKPRKRLDDRKAILSVSASTI